MRDRVRSWDAEGEKEKRARDGRVYEDEVEGGDVVSNPRTQSFVSIRRPVHRRVGH